MKKIILSLTIVTQMVVAGGQEGTGSDPETTTSNNAYEYIQVCIDDSEGTGEEVETITTCIVTPIQSPSLD